MNSLGPTLDGLNPNLIAHFRPVDYDGKYLGDTEVVAPLTDGGILSAQFNWQSPFEQMSPESKAPTIAAMLQSGAVLPLINAARDKLANLASGQSQDSAFGYLTEKLLAPAAQAANATSAYVRSLRGRTGVTKLNSEQIFSGLPPMKISFTLLIKAWLDPKKEVMQPIQQLMEWAHPQFLAPDGVLAGLIVGDNGPRGLNRLLPSTAPNLLNFRYGNQVFQQMVIESIELPITAPRNKSGDWVSVELPITLASLTSFDQNDIHGIFGGT
jgi:hypothetical protein